MALFSSIEVALFSLVKHSRSWGNSFRKPSTTYIAQHEGEIERSDKRSYDRTKAR